MIYKPTIFALNITNTLAQHRAIVKLIVLLVMLALMATGVLADGNGTPNPCPLC